MHLAASLPVLDATAFQAVGAAVAPFAVLAGATHASGNLLAWLGFVAVLAHQFFVLGPSGCAMHGYAPKRM